MNQPKFRKLRADEIECRIGMVKEKGLSLLLYKDARCDMNILDETVGAMNWKREHTRDNANCTVSIYDEDKHEWVGKEDVGTESNTEAAKGLASDSFKRACVNWGIGRELYSAPFIWVKANDAHIQKIGDKFRCYDTFRVEKLTYLDNGNIDAIAIRNEKTGGLAFVKMPAKKKKPAKPSTDEALERADDEYERRRDADDRAEQDYIASLAPEQRIG